MKPRWCHRCRDYRTRWLPAYVGRLRVKLCGSCGAVTRATKPQQPAHRAADRRQSEAVRDAADNKCVACGGPASDGAHILTKGAHPKMRYAKGNVLSACRDCHRRWHAHPEEFRAFLAQHAPGLLELLTESAR